MQEKEIIQVYKRANSKMILIREDGGQYVCVYTNLQIRLADLIDRKIPKALPLVADYITREVPSFIKIKGDNRDQVITSCYRAFKSYHYCVIKRIFEELASIYAIATTRYGSYYSMCELAIDKTDHTNEEIAECTCSNDGNDETELVVNISDLLNIVDKDNIDEVRRIVSQSFKVATERLDAIAKEIKSHLQEDKGSDDNI